MEWVFVVIMALQWLVILWMVFSHRVEVKRLTTDLKESLEGAVYSAEQTSPVSVPPPEMTIPHPNNPGQSVTLQHIGGGNYGPDEQTRLNVVEEVEGTM